MPQMQLAIREAKLSSVRQFPEGYRQQTPLILQMALAADEVPAWWTPARDAYLRTFWHGEPMLASALYSMCARNAGFRWEIVSADPNAKQWAVDMLNGSEFGEGWQELMLKVSLDLYSADNGAALEVIRPGRAKVDGKYYPAISKRHKKSRDIDWFAVLNRRGAVKQVSIEDVSDSPLDLPLGLAHMDIGKVTRTGDPDVPVIYTDRYGTEHEMQSWQVITMSDMPSTIEEMHGVGFSLISRVFRSAQTIRDWVIYREEKISGRFARSVHLTNIDAEAISDAIAQAGARSDEMGLLRYSQPIIANTLDPSARPWNETIDLASLPEGWSEDEAMRWYVAVIALAAGEHYSFFAPMPGRRLGSAREVEVQERQARGKSSRLFMQSLTVKLNNAGVFPKGCAFVFGERDPEEQAANEESALRRAKTRRERIESLEITPAIARQLANDQGDLSDKYLELMGETDLTPEQAQGTEDSDVAATNAPRLEEMQIEGELAGSAETDTHEKQITGEPLEPWGDEPVPISREDVIRAIRKWDERVPEAAGLLLARKATAAEEAAGNE